ncbi:MAG: heavy metal translocating P-type ATPase [Chloroflexota bacterium]
MSDRQDNMPGHKTDETCACGHDHLQKQKTSARGDTCDCAQEKANDDDINPRRELAFIIPALLLMVGGIIRHYVLGRSGYDGAEYAIFLLAYGIAGWPTLTTAARNIARGRFFDEYFLMTLATVAAIAIGELPEAVGVMLFFRIGEFCQGLSLRHSRRSIKALMQVRPDSANLVIPDGLKTVSPGDVKVGETIVIRPGEKVPLDGEVIEGDSMLDTSPLTGESVPRSIHPGDAVMAGCLNGQGLLRVRVTRKFGKSSVSKILELVEHAAEKKARTEQFITRFARYYTPIVVGFAVMVAVIGPLATGDPFRVWIYRAAVLLVISCPCALVISIPLGYFGGIGGASRRGILVKGAQYLDVLAKVKIVVFDKTGTLTKGVFKVVEIVPAEGHTSEELLHLAHQAEVHSSHPIAQSIIGACGCGTTPSNVCNFEVITGSGVKAYTDNSTIIACNDVLLHENEIPHEVCEVGGTGVHLVVNDRYAGHIVIADELRDDAAVAVSRLRRAGVRKVMMLTGDCDEVASRVAAKLGLDEYRAGMMPEDKVNAIAELEAGRAPGEKIAAVGDGINDAPLLARADVGVAMGGLGSDAALESADVVIMNDQPSKLAEAIMVGRKTRAVVWQNIGLAMGIKALFIVFGIAGLATLWEAVFADVGVALLAIANATRVLR